MLSTMKTLSLLAAFAGTSIAGPISQQGSPGSAATCVDLTIPVTVSAQNAVNFTTPLTFQTVSGTYNIAARYCEPQNYVPSRHNTLQFLVHGIGYTRHYWSGDDNDGFAPFDGSIYSWVDFASGVGFPTLAIDRLGQGLSDHPDPIQVLQTPMHVEVYHQLIAKARTGSLPGGPKRGFEKIVYVGHSYGSLTGNALNTKYPKDVDAMILTGMTTLLNGAFLGPWEAGGITPASIYKPSKWANLNPGYLALSDKALFEQAFYYPGHFDQALIDRDFDIASTFGVGELQSVLFFPVLPATQFKAPVLDITGQHDTLFCTSDNPAQMMGPWKTYDCGTAVADTKSLYPNAYYTPYAPDAGHCLNFHLSAQSTFGYAHNWLNYLGF